MFMPSNSLRQICCLFLCVVDFNSYVFVLSFPFLIASARFLLLDFAMNCGELGSELLM